jgi:hypothetical protein
LPWSSLLDELELEEELEPFEPLDDDPLPPLLPDLPLELELEDNPPHDHESTDDDEDDDDEPLDPFDEPLPPDLPDLPLLDDDDDDDDDDESHPPCHEGGDPQLLCSCQWSALLLPLELDDEPDLPLFPEEEAEVVVVAASTATRMALYDLDTNIIDSARNNYLCLFVLWVDELSREMMEVDDE